MIYDDTELAALLASVKTIAVVGASDKPGRPVDNVARKLIEWGYDVIPVHPKRQDVWGLKTYPSLMDLPGPVDVADLFRAAQYCPDHAREILEMPVPPRLFWMQSGIVSPEARDILASTPVTVIEDRCLMVEIARLTDKGGPFK